MSDERDGAMARAARIFEKALERPAAERVVFLDGACGSDLALRRLLAELMRAHEKQGGFLSPSAERSPAAPVQKAEAAKADPSRGPTAWATAPVEEEPGARIGPYKLLQKLGEGGFGVVFMAEQQVPVRRRVALKIIKLGMDTRQVVARFEQERQALALMDHPHIARVLDAGSTETGRPYFVMELVRGVPITQFCDDEHLTPRERLDLFVPVCMAVQHAHSKGVIHRDIKPSNILVTLHDGKPVPKIIDFGIAKATDRRLTEKTLFTELRGMIGTPVYMSPEQAELSGLDVDTRSDVYSLGVLLYELLTGTTPFTEDQLKAAGYAEMQRFIREVEPPRPSTRVSTLGQAITGIASRRKIEPKKLGLLLRGDLDWVVMKALEKDRARRYETATGLAQDIERHLHGEPVLAAPPSASYRLRKFVRRNSGVVTAAGVILALLLGSTIVLYSSLKDTRRSRDELRVATQKAEAEARRAEEGRAHAEAANREKDRALEESDRQLYVVKLAAVQSALSENDYAKASSILSDECAPPQRGWEWGYLNGRSKEAEYIIPVSSSFVLSADGSRMLDKRDGLSTWDTETRRQVRRFEGWDSYSGDTLSPDASRVLIERNSELIELDASNGQRRAKQSFTGSISATYGPRGDHIAVIVQDRKEVQILGADLVPQQPLPYVSNVTGIGFDATEALLAVGEKSGLVRVWDVATGNLRHEWLEHSNTVGNISFHPGGRYLATSSSDGTTRCYDLGTGQLLRIVRTNGECIWIPGEELALSSCGPRIWSPLDATRDIHMQASAEIAVVDPTRKRIAALGYGGLSLIDRANGHVLATAPVEQSGTLRYTPDGTHLIAGNQVFDADLSHTEPRRDWSAASRADLWFVVLPGRLWASGPDGVRRLWDTNTGVVVKALPVEEFIAGVHTTTDGARLLLDRNVEGSVVVMDVQDGHESARLEPESPSHAYWNGLDQAGDLVGAVEDGDILGVWNIRTGRRVARLEQSAHNKQYDLNSVRFSPQGGFAFAHNSDGVGVVWNLATGKEVARTARPTRDAQHNAFAAFDPEDRYLVVSQPGADVFLHELATGVRRKLGSPGTSPDLSDTTSAYFAGSGEDLVTESLRGIRVWDAETGHEYLRDATCAELAHAKEIRLSSARNIAVARMTEGKLSAYAFGEIAGDPKDIGGGMSGLALHDLSPDGIWVCVSDSKGGVQVWNTIDGTLVEDKPRLGPSRCAAQAHFDDRGKHVVVSWGVENLILDLERRGSVPIRLSPLRAGGASVCFASENRVTASQGSDIVQVWDASTGAEWPPGIETILAKEPVQSTLFSGDLSSFVVTTLAGAAYLHRGDDGQRLATLWVECPIQYRAVLSADGRRMAISMGRDACAHVRNTLDPYDGFILLGEHEAAVHCIALTPDGAHAMTGSHDGTAKIWRRIGTENAMTTTLSVGGDEIACIGLDPKALYGYVGTKNGRLLRYDGSTGMKLGEVAAHPDALLSISFTPDGEHLLTRSRTSVHSWELDLSRGTFAVEGDGELNDLELNREGSMAAVACANAPVRLFDRASGQLIQEFEVPSVARCVAFDKPGQCIAVGLDSGVCIVFSIADRKEIARLSGHSGPVLTTVFLPDGSRLFTGSADRTWRLWDPVRQKDLLKFNENSEVTDLWVTPDGRRVIGFTSDGRGFSVDSKPDILSAKAAQTKKTEPR